jgi:hypothetical protein
MRLILIITVFLLSCKKDERVATSNIPIAIPIAYKQTKTITYNNINVDVLIDKPALNEVDVLLVFHGTVMYDSSIMTAANNTLDKFKGILDRKDNSKDISFETIFNQV